MFVVATLWCSDDTRCPHSYWFCSTAVDTTLLTILVLLVLATVLAILRARRRDRCLRALDAFHVTLAEQDGDLVWGCAHIYATGLEIEYPKPVVARGAISLSGRLIAGRASAPEGDD